MFAAASATLHRRRCIHAMLCMGMGMYGHGQWAMNATYVMHMRRCVTAMKKKILSKENFFAISNIVQNSVGKQLGKLFFSPICQLE